MVTETKSETPEIEVGPNARAFLGRPKKCLISGKWVDAASGESFSIFNPANGSIIDMAPSGDMEDIDAAVKAARKVFDDPKHVWNTMTPSDRGRLIWKIGDLILENLDELAELESLDNGKPVGVAKVADVPLSADLFHYMAGWTTKIEGNTIPISVPYAPGAKFHAFTMREPVGVVGQIIPWNLLVPLAQPFTAGLYRFGAGFVYVNRGTGYWGPPMRIGVPAEITLVTLRRGDID